MSEPYHVPVLADEAVNLLITDKNGYYVDGTIGGGGHAKKILDRITSPNHLIGLDADAEAIAESKRVLPSGVHLFQTRFSRSAPLIRTVAPDGVQGVLLDLGVSSHQLDFESRGFSYRSDAPLDLRMNPNDSKNAADLLAHLDVNELMRLIRDYGEDPQARRIAKAIVAAREKSPIRTTGDLATVIKQAVPATQHKSLPRIFQALRIIVNNELEEVERGLLEFWQLIRLGGRFVVISYHSLEDRRVKQFFQSLVHPSESSHPLAPPLSPKARPLTRKPVVPSETELLRNPRSRSAKLRAIEKL